MPRLSMVTLAELPELPCPYCGRVLGTDTPWAASAATLWGWCGARLVVGDEVVKGWNEVALRRLLQPWLRG